MSAGVVAAHYVDAAPGGGGTGYAAAVLADSPLAYWRLDESTGAFVDQTGNGKTLTTVGTVTRITPGAVTSSTGAVTVNDTSGYLDSNLALASVTALTIEVWYKGSDNQGVFAQCRPASGGSSLTLSMGGDPFGNTQSARVGFGVDTAGVYLGAKGAVVVNDSNWRHIVGTWQGASGVNIAAADFKVFVDAVLDNNGTTGGGTIAAPLSSGGQGYRFGAPSPGGWSFGGIAGSLDEIAIYPTALSAARIAAHYAARTS